ncbi:MAG: tetratricopeptide repeat protein, partial [Alphaproteobacteria bacterium]|nr:tetratricopeptide repeat protein [Alphaproteobacteria bacterium]
IYSRGIDTISEPEPKHWALFYYRGICRERLKDWGPAEADFRQSLALSPDQPLVLNYLGYSLVDRGLKLSEALDMIRKAVELRPRDGYIVDSLGWAYYKLGRYEEAVVELEKAVALRPEDPIINDHLGDAYWKVDRRLEARFQWNHARDLEPEPEELPKILDKIENGLREDGAIPAATVGQDLKDNGG